MYPMIIPELAMRYVIGIPALQTKEGLRMNAESDGRASS
jgi:hypothetical protein